MKPTYDELLTIIEEQRRTIARLEKKVEELEERNAKLEESLNLNSRNSSKPPSSDQKRNKRPSNRVILAITDVFYPRVRLIERSFPRARRAKAVGLQT